MLMYWQSISGFKSHEFYGVLLSYPNFRECCDL